MKNLIILLNFLFIASSGYASDITAIKNGQWTSSSTWSSNSTPVSGDNITIPSGITVQINSNMNMGSSTFSIQIYGKLEFVGGGAKLTISNSSTIYVFGTGTIDGGGNPSQVINIGGNQVYNAKSLNTVTGPSYANSSTPGFVGFTPLPVKFINFTVNFTSGKDVLLKWSTAQEINADKYEVERSYDGSNWNTIAYVLAVGNSNDVNSYSYSDKNNTGSVVCYRIKQIDLNGQFTYSKVETLRSAAIASKTEIGIGASEHKIFLQFSNEVKGNVIVRFISFSGQVLSQEVVNQPVGRVILTASAFLRGNYIVSVSNGQDINTARQIIL